MDEIYEERRKALATMIAQMGRGAIAEIGRTIDVDQSYISRCLYPPTKAGAKRIGDEMVVKLDKHYPGWLYTEQGYAAPLRSEYEQRILNYLSKLSEIRRQVVEQTIVGLVALEEAERNAEAMRQQNVAME